MKHTFRSLSRFTLAIGMCFLLSSCAGPRVARVPGDTAAVYDTQSFGPSARIDTYHAVAPGETLWRISKMYDVDIEDIKKANNIRDVKDIDIGRKLFIPDAASRRNVITLYPNRKWTYIIIHHSATDFGNSMQFNKAHLARGWEGIGYHFIIDNGSCGKDDGQIEIGPRWTKQQDGAHCKADNMNERGIGICLVGNFSKGQPTRKQMDSLVYLVNKLRKYYRIPVTNIMGHGQVTGAKTECPGKKFPWKTFKSRLSKG